MTFPRDPNHTAQDGAPVPTVPADATRVPTLPARPGEGEAVTGQGLPPTAASHTRQVYVFTIPPERRASHYGGASHVHVVRLLASEELAAAKRARGEQARVSFELVKASLVGVTYADQRGTLNLSTTDGSVENAWEVMPAPLRALVTHAYGLTNTPAQEDVLPFTVSMAAVGTQRT